MGGVELQDAACLVGEVGVHPLHVLLHLEAHARVGHQAHGVGLEGFAHPHLLDLFAQGLLDEVQHVLGLLLGLLGFLLLLVALEAKILGGDVAELLLPHLHERLGNKLVHILGEEQNVVALVLDQLRLGKLGKTVAAFTGGVIDILLIGAHGVHVLLEGDQLILLARPEEQQLLEEVLMGAVVGHHAVLELTAKGGIELLVLLPLVLLHPNQLGLDLLFQVGGDDLQLTVVLEHLTGDVEAQILGVHNAADEAEVLGQQIRAVFHNEHAGRIELQALLIVLGVVVIGRAGRDKQHGLEGHSALDGEVNGGKGFFKVKELIAVELRVLLRLDVLLIPLPQWHHGVEGLGLHHSLVLGLGVLLLLLSLGLLL